MSDSDIKEAIDEKIASKVYTQDYSKQSVIEGVKIVPLQVHPSEEGDFGEVLRAGPDGYLEKIPGFSLAQINRTTLLANSVKAWHLHLKQDEVWYAIPSGQLFVGLWDIRKNSPTTGQTMRLVLGGGNSQLLFIPQGVAHGSANFTKKPVELFYFVNKHFDITKPDEKRIPWDSLGKDFWKPQRD